MKKEFTPYLPIAEAICQLLAPHAEVLIHDLETHRIAAIFNNYSKRRVGDESLIGENGKIDNFPDYFPPYYKRNIDGRKIKSTSVTIRDKQGRAVGLLCINLDVSVMEQFQHFLDSFVQAQEPAAQPEKLFKDDWAEKIHQYIHEYLQKRNIHLSAMSRKERNHLIEDLYKNGAFNAVKSADHIAEMIGISRATMFNHLAKLKKS